MNTAHVQAIINKSYQIKGTHRIWQLAEKHNLILNHYTAWKFCILMHTILHDGPKQALNDGQGYKSILEKCGQYWRSLQGEDMGPCIVWYFQVLLRKLTFHQMHKHMKGNLHIEYEPAVDLDRV